MTLPAQLFPGIYFERDASLSRSSLPSMDVASFVGFATSGPLHTPVPIEDIEQYRDIFGEDVRLAWDAEEGRAQGGYLGVSVEKFFRNGGARCWVVRVADETIAQTGRYDIPGLICTNGVVIESATALARSPGSWAEGVTMRSQLQIVSIPLTRTGSTVPALSIASDGWSAYLRAFESQLQPGDLLAVDTAEQQGTYYLFLDAVVSSVQGVLVSGTRGFFHVASSTPSSPDVDASFTIGDGAPPDGIELFRLADFDELDLSFTYPNSSVTGDLPRVRLLHFSIDSQDSRGRTTSLSNLAFVGDHPRCWTHLQDDQQFYRPANGRRVEQYNKATQSLLTESGTPRFPFAGSAQTADWFYLPVAMNAGTGAVARAVFQPEEPDRSTRDGLANFGSIHFIDARLAHLGSETLAQEAKRLAFLTETTARLRGIHGLLVIDEPTLIAVPDAVHRRWHTEPRRGEPRLSAPILAPVEKLDDQEPCYRVSWSAVDQVRVYVLEWDNSPDFTAPMVKRISADGHDSFAEPLIPGSSPVNEAPLNEAVVPLDVNCPDTYFFRVRCETSSEISAWSNNICVHVPVVDFLQCGYTQPEMLHLMLSEEVTGGGISSPSMDNEFEIALNWQLSTTIHSLAYAAIDVYEIQCASDCGFFVIDSEIRIPAAELNDPAQPGTIIEGAREGVRYYRVRAIAGETTGPWSNTIMAEPAYLDYASVEHSEDYSDSDLLAIHRALLRSCGARGDLFAVLGVPRHYQAEDVIAYYSALMPASNLDTPAAMPVTMPVDDFTAFVTPLSLGESHLSSYAALYYPWVTTRSNYVPASGDTLQTIPADGTVLGGISAKTTSQGAWISPGNTLLRDVLALHININANQWRQLTAARVNVIRREPRGYLVLSADTLSTDMEYGEISTRRLVCLIKRLVLDQGDRLVFETNDERLHDRVKQQFETLLAGMYARGAFAGAQASQAFRVITDGSINTPQSLAAGRFLVELHIAPAQPLKYLKIRLLQEGGKQTQVQEIAR